MATLEVVIELVLRKVDVSVRFLVEVAEDLARQDRSQEFIGLGSELESVVDSRLVLGYPVHILIVQQQQFLHFVVVAVKHLFLFQAHFLQPFLFFLSLFLLFKVLFRLLLGSFDLFLLLTNSVFLLFQGVLPQFFGFFECFLRLFKLLAGCGYIGIVIVWICTIILFAIAIIMFFINWLDFLLGWSLLLYRCFSNWLSRLSTRHH